MLQVVKQCDGDKAPGPNGFTVDGKIRQRLLGHSQGVLMHTIQNNHQKGVFEKSLNATFIALIAKKVVAGELTNLRQINRIGGVYKIISKLITERLKTIMGKQVDEHQMAFLKGRQIMDAILLANELVDSMVGQKTPEICALMIMLTSPSPTSSKFQRAKDIDFGTKWINWINYYTSPVKFSLIINGSNEGFFQSQRSSRQEDPMSHFLFILAMEGLTHMIRMAKRNGWIEGFYASPNRSTAMEVTHLSYVNDSLVFCDANVSQMRHLRDTLTIF